MPLACLSLRLASAPASLRRRQCLGPSGKPPLTVHYQPPNGSSSSLTIPGQAEALHDRSPHGRTWSTAAQRGSSCACTAASPARGVGPLAYKMYGDAAISVGKNEPYRPAADVWSVGFKTVDTI